MKYVSIDLETTGLDPENCQIIEFSAIIDDGESALANLPKFHCYVVANEYRGDPYALSMHSTIFRRISDRPIEFRFICQTDLAVCFKNFLLNSGLTSHITVAGKNFASFDWRFLRRMPAWDTTIKIRHRVIDPGNLYWNPVLDGERLPNLKTCLKRAGFEHDVAHTAFEDALDVVLLVRHYLEK